MPGMFDYEDHDLALPDIDPEAVAHGPLTDEDWDERAQTALRDLEGAYGLRGGSVGPEGRFATDYMDFDDASFYLLEEQDPYPTHYEGGTYEL